MNRYDAIEIVALMTRIEKIEKCLKSFCNKSYQYSFKIRRENEEFPLEQKVLALIIDYYKKELAELNKNLSEL